MKCNILRLWWRFLANKSSLKKAGGVFFFFFLPKRRLLRGTFEDFYFFGGGFIHPRAFFNKHILRSVYLGHEKSCRSRNGSHRTESGLFERIFTSIRQGTGDPFSCAVVLSKLKHALGVILCSLMSLRGAVPPLRLPSPQTAGA